MSASDSTSCVASQHSSTHSPSGATHAVDRMTAAAGDTQPHRFHLTHPKNYIGVPLAVAADAPTEILVPQHLVKMAGEAAFGAQDLGLVTNRNTLTERGQIIVDTAAAHYNSPEDALMSLGENARSRFISANSKFAAIAQAVFATYHSVIPFVAVLDAQGPLTLPELAIMLADTRPEALSETLLSLDRIPDESPIETLQSSQRPSWLSEADTYHSLSTYQLKSLLCHVGILTTPGADSTHLDPDSDVWALSPHLSTAVRERIVANLGGDRQ
mgnify:CR=1 FL=1